MEKRQHPRIPCEITARWQALESGPASGPSLVSDISEGGVRFRSNAFIGVRRRLRVKLELPGLPALSAAVEPVWVRSVPGVGQYEVGARFLTLSEAERGTIRGFLQTVSR